MAPSGARLRQVPQALCQVETLGVQGARALEGVPSALVTPHSPSLIKRECIHARLEIQGKDFKPTKFKLHPHTGVPINHTNIFRLLLFGGSEGVVSKQISWAEVSKGIITNNSSPSSLLFLFLLLLFSFPFFLAPFLRARVSHRPTSSVRQTQRPTNDAPDDAPDDAR